MVNVRERSIIPEGGTVLLSFSGGVDSLALLNLLLSKGNVVHTVYLNGSQGSGKVAAEAIHRNKALAHLREKYPGLLGQDKYVHLEVTYSRAKDDYKQSISNTGCYFGQPVDWVYGMVQATRCFNDSFTHVALGYLSTDQFSVHAMEFATAFEAMHGFTSNKVDIERPLVIFPLIHRTKEMTIDYLKKEELLHLAWWCELPNIVGSGEVDFKVLPCNKCPACRTHYFANLASRFKHTPINLIEEAIIARHEFLDREYDANAPLQQTLCFDETETIEADVYLKKEQPEVTCS